jgi:hypothetical protein
MANVNLYQYPQVVQLSQPGAISSASVMNRSDFSIFKNVDNDVEFLVKTYDNKPIDLTGKTITIYVVDARDDALKIQKELSYSPTMAKKGHARLTLALVDIAEIDPGYLYYSISVKDITAKETLLYTDHSRTVQGFFELQQGPLPGPTSAIVIPESMFAQQSWGSDTSVSNYLVAEPFPGAAQRDNRTGVHTIAVYGNKYSGYLNVQGSLENSPPSDMHEWFNIDIGDWNVDHCDHCDTQADCDDCDPCNPCKPCASRPVNPAPHVPPVTPVPCPHHRYHQPIYKFTCFTGIKHFSFTGSYMWIRFILNASPINQGAITKILFKN